MLPCKFSQRQGFMRVTRDAGVTHELAPDADTVGNFVDQDGRTIYRQSGLGDQGLIFRFPDERVVVCWDVSALDPTDAGNPTHRLEAS